MNKNCKVIYKKIEPNFLNKYGYINLNHREVNTKDDLVEISSIFRNPMYETFRIIYMKDNKIVGHEQISSRNPTTVCIFPKSKDGNLNHEKCFYKIQNRMERLGSNGYYMVHNHPSGNAKASRQDLHVTSIFNKYVKGFKGHLIINLESYAWIDVDKNGRSYCMNYIPINKFKKDRFYKMMTKKSIYDMKILCRDDLVYLMHHIKNTQEYSTAILTDCIGKVRMILDVPNRLLNIPSNQLKGYFDNLSRLNGTSRVFFSSPDNETYKKSLQHLENGIFTDCICYKNEKNKIYTYERVNMFKEINNKLTKNIFSINEEQEKYYSKESSNIQNVPLDILDVPEDKIRILYKPIGKPAIPLTIKNTLEAKQKLVGGKIEVIQYEDVLIVCNEEGKILNKPCNIVFDYDYIAGNFFIIGDDYTNADFKSLTLDEIEKYKKDIDSRSLKYKNKETNNKSKESYSIRKYTRENTK